MDAGKTKSFGNLGNIESFFPEQLLCFLHFGMEPIIHGTVSGGFFKDSGQIGTTYAKLGAKQGKRGRFVQIVLNKINNRVYQRAFCQLPGILGSFQWCDGRSAVVADKGKRNSVRYPCISWAEPKGA